MAKRIHFCWLALMVVAFIFISVTNAGHVLAWDVPENVPGDFEGKWYGIHCPDVPKKEIVGLVDGQEAFPSQTIMDSWGYKAKPIEQIKDLLPEIYFNMCSHPGDWGDIRINETAYIPIAKWPGEHRRLMDETTKRNLGSAHLDEKGHIVNYKNGVPFPGSTNGLELAWNFVYSRISADELLSRFYIAVVDKTGHTRYMVGEVASLAWKGRLHGENTPNLEPNPKNYESFFSFGFRSPYDLKGLVGSTHRYDCADKEDDQWLFLPQIRRVRNN